METLDASYVQVAIGTLLYLSKIAAGLLSSNGCLLLGHVAFCG